jgi:hypothetical protein
MPYLTLILQILELAEPEKSKEEEGFPHHLCPRDPLLLP